MARRIARSIIGAPTFAKPDGAPRLRSVMRNAVSTFPRGLVLFGCALVAGAAAWYGALRRGAARVVGLAVAGLALAGAVVVLVVGGAPVADLLVVAGLLVCLAASRTALAVHADLPGASRARHAVLSFNPRSGGGKAERFRLAAEARERVRIER